VKKEINSMKKAFALTICLVLALSLFSGCTSTPTTNSATPGSGVAATTPDGATSVPTSDETIVIVVGHVQAENHPYHLALLELQRVLDEMAPGAIQLNLFPNSQLGGERDLLEGQQMGTVDVSLPSTASLGLFTDTFTVFDLPFLLPNREAAYHVLDGPIGQSLLDTLPNIGLVGIAYWENGFRYITNNQHDIFLPTDIPSGLTIRTMENEIQMQTFITLGANAVPMAWAEVYTALQQGVVDGVENPFAVLRGGRFYEVAKYLSLTAHIRLITTWFTSTEWFNNLPRELQEMLIETGRLAGEENNRLVARSDEETLAYFRSQGVEIINIDIAPLQAASRAFYTLPEMLERWTPGLVDRVTRAKAGR